MNWHEMSEPYSTAAERVAREESLRQRVRQLNAQIDDLGRTLQIPHRELMECVNRLIAAARRPARPAAGSRA